MIYRAEIDGLRALAVSVVVLFHAGVPGFSGGYLGVDVFFVISGFLITSVIVDSAGRKGVLLNFYARRIGRLLPALYFVLLVILLVVYAFTLPDFLVSYAQSMISVLLISSNFFFYREGGYFAEASERLPLLHTWSLSVEEQFYLFFPFFFFFLLRFFSVHAFKVLCLAAAVSFLGYAWAIFKYPDAAFFFAPTRGWELLWGGILALVSREGKLRFNPRVADLLCWLSLLVMVVSFYYVGSEMNPLWGVGAVIFAGVFLLVTPFSVRVKRVFSRREVVLLGVLSYSLYLWHQPIFSLYRVVFDMEISLLVACGLIAISLGLSYVTYSLIENPFRRRFIVGVRASFVFLVLAGGVLLLACWFIIRADGFKAYFDPSVAKYFKTNTESGFNYVSECHSNIEKQFSGSGCGLNFARQKQQVILYGDSHAGAMAYSLANYLSAWGGVRLFTYNGCRPLLGRYTGVVDKNDDGCRAFNERFMAYLDGDAEIPVLIVSFRWAADFPEGNRRDGGLLGGFSRVPIGVLSPEVARTGLVDDMWQTLLRISKRVGKLIIIYPVPRAPFDVPERLSNSVLRGASKVLISYKSFEEESKFVEGVLDSVKGENIFRIRPVDYFCSRQSDSCAVADREASYYIDDNHLSVHGADYLLEHSGLREMLQ